MSAVWRQIVQGWERLLERLRPVVDLDPFRREREASDEYERQRQKWRSRLNRAAEVANVMPALLGESAEAHALRQVEATYAEAVAFLKDPQNPAAVQILLDYYRQHYRGELRAAVSRRRWESGRAYAARREAIVKALMREGIKDDLLRDAMRAYIDAPPRASWEVLLDGFIRWLNWQGVLGIALLVIFVWAGPWLAARINTLGRSLFHTDGIGNGSWASLLFLIVMVPVLVWLYGGWGALWRWMKKRGRVDA